MRDWRDVLWYTMCVLAVLAALALVVPAWNWNGSP